MRLTSFLLTLGFLQLHAAAYEQTISISQKNADLSSLFKKISRQTGFTFLYNDKTLKNAKTVDIDVKDASLNEVLRICFSDQPLTYSIVNKTVVIQAKEAELPRQNAPPPGREIKGRILDSVGAPIGGATVAIKGTSKAVATNANGEFTITVPEGNVTLVISSVGYTTQEVKVGTHTVLNINLMTSSVGMEDMVVSALGIKRDRRSLGYATATIGGDELLKAGATMNPFLAIYGKAAGVGVNIGSSGPEGGIKINIRAAFSINSQQNVRPLFVVDGVIISDRSTSIGGALGAGFDYGAGINDINAEDIESIEILKGAKATVLYGSGAAQGVVIITTKSGKNAKGLGMTGFFQYTAEKPVQMIKFQNEYGLGESIYDTSYATVNGQKIRTMSNDRFSFGPKFDGANVMFYDSTTVKNVAHPNNYLDLFQTGHSYTSNVAIAGSNEKGSMRASYTNYDYRDIISPNSYQKRNTFSFNGSIKASNLASFELATNIYSVNTQNRRGSNAMSIAWGFPRDWDYKQMYNLYKDSTGYKRDLSNYGAPTAVGELGDYMWALEKNRYQDNKLHMINAGKVTLHFTPHIFLIGQAGLDYENTDYITETSVDRVLPTVSGGSFSYTKESNTVQNYQALLNYDKTFSNDWHLYAFGGFVYLANSLTTLGSTTIGGLNYAGWYSFSNEAGIAAADNEYLIRNFTRSSYVQYSALGSATLSWKNEFYAELQGRQDWNSTLPPANNKYFYPGLSLTWNYTERFKIPHMNRGKFRMAWADAGFGTTPYWASNQYTFSRLTGTTAVTITPPGPILPGSLKPQRRREFEAGLDNSFFKGDRLVLSFSYYFNHVYDQIMTLPTSAASSSTGLNINAGNVRNIGYEVSVTFTPVLTKDLRWDVILNGASQKSKVIQLYNGLTTYIQSNLINGSAASIHADQGRPAGEIVMNDYSRDPSGNKIVSGGLYSIDAQKTIEAGNVMPKIYGGFLSDLYYKSFDLRIGMDYKYGGTIFSYTNNRLTGDGQLASTLQYRDQQHGGLAYYIDNSGNYVQTTHDASAPAASVDGKVYHDGLILPGVMLDASSGKYVKNTVLTSAKNYYETYANDVATSFPPDHLYKNNYIKLREIALAYTLPKSVANKIKFQGITITLAGRNLFYIYKSIPNIDPESAIGADQFVENTIYPAQRTYSAGVNLAF